MIRLAKSKRRTRYLVGACLAACIFIGGNAPAQETGTGESVFTLGEIEVTTKDEEDHRR